MGRRGRHRRLGNRGSHSYKPINPRALPQQGPYPSHQHASHMNLSSLRTPTSGRCSRPPKYSLRDEQNDVIRSAVHFWVTLARGCVLFPGQGLAFGLSGRSGQCWAAGPQTTPGATESQAPLQVLSMHMGAETRVCPSLQVEGLCGAAALVAPVPPPQVTADSICPLCCDDSWRFPALTSQANSSGTPHSLP